MFAFFLTFMCVLGAQGSDLHRVIFSSTSVAHSAPKVHCWCSSFPNQTLCSWADPPHAAPVQYIATYSERQTQVETRPCHVIPPGDPALQLGHALPSSSPQAWRCHLPELKLLTDYILNVTAVYPAGSSSHLSTFMVEDIVKPDPPVAVRVSSPDPRTVLVQWEPPSTWTNMDIFPLKYQLLYQWRNGKIQSHHVKPIESTGVNLRGLSRGRTYQIQVCAQDMLGLGHCSDWSLPVNVTVPL